VLKEFIPDCRTTAGECDSKC